MLPVMTKRLRIAVTADLHWGVRSAGDAATLLLIEFLRTDPPDVLVLAGDVGAGKDFAECLARFADLPCRKALVPGNHDIWVTDDDQRGDSLTVYQQALPQTCLSQGFHYLDGGPLLLPEAGLALVGTMNWYDYSWSLDRLRACLPDWEERLRTKRFSRGRHNDARFIRWPLNDVLFTAQVVAAFERHLQAALHEVGWAIIVTHHPPFFGLNYPAERAEATPDRLLWEAFSGNQALEELLKRYAVYIPFAFCGHTHRERENKLGLIRGYNVGGDYHFKRLLVLDWPAGTVLTHRFGDPDAEP